MIARFRKSKLTSFRLMEPGTWMTEARDPGKRTDWLRLIRAVTQYAAPGLIVAVMVAELSTSTPLSSVYNYFILAVFAPLTIAMIAICWWTVFLWDIDRLFFKLENRIDAEAGDSDVASSERQQDGSLLGRARELLNSKVRKVKTTSIGLIEKAYWDDINAGGILAFPQPDIAAAVERIDRGRRDLLVPLSELVATTIPLGPMPASIVSRLIFKYVAAEVKVRLYRRLVLRFLTQLGALFALTSVCFYISVLAWSRVDGRIFSVPSATPTSVLLYQIDLMLRGALFDFMEHTRRSVSPLTINQNVTVFVYYTLMFRMFVAIYVIASVFKVLRFIARRWRTLLRPLG